MEKKENIKFSEGMAQLSLLLVGTISTATAVRDIVAGPVLVIDSAKMAQVGVVLKGILWKGGKKSEKGKDDKE